MSKPTIGEILDTFFVLNQTDNLEQIESWKGLKPDDRLKEQLTQLIADIVGEENDDRVEHDAQWRSGYNSKLYEQRQRAKDLGIDL